MTSHPVEVRDLRKVYGAAAAVDGVSFDIRAGEVYALLGHNGAGKTTTVEILEGHRSRTSGTVRVLGHDPARGGRALRDRIGIVLQTAGVEPELSVREAVHLFAAPYSRPRDPDEVIGMVGLDHKADDRIGTLSGGQRRRADLALGIVGDPELLFLDEPTTGFDPAARRRSWELVAELCRGGTTVLLTTHYLDEAEHLADRVGVLARGRMVAEGTPAELIGASDRSTVSCSVDGATDVSALRGSLPDGAELTTDGPTHHVTFATADPTADVHRLTGWALDHGVRLEGLVVAKPSLEDVYLELADVEPEHVDEVGSTDAPASARAW